MKPGKRKETGAVLVEAVRIAVGSGAAMYAASLLHLELRRIGGDGNAAYDTDYQMGNTQASQLPVF